MIPTIAEHLVICYLTIFRKYNTKFEIHRALKRCRVIFSEIYDCNITEALLLIQVGGGDF